MIWLTVALRPSAFTSVPLKKRGVTWVICGTERASLRISSWVRSLFLILVYSARGMSMGKTGRMKMVWLPARSTCLSTLVLRPWTRLTTTMTAATPMMMPRVVSAERILLALRARMAAERGSRTSITSSRPWSSPARCRTWPSASRRPGPSAPSASGWGP